jgi:hypothetical protein
METFQVVYRGQNLMRITISQKYGPYAVVDCFMSLTRCWEECASVGRWGPESFETTTTMYKSPIKIYRVDE